MNCSRCGALLVPGARFCDICGAQFALVAGPAVMAQQGQMAQAASAASKPGGMAIAGMVTGILAICLVWTVWLAIPLAVCAIVFGAIGLGYSNRGERGGRGFAITGISTGIISLGILVIGFLVAASFIADALP